MVCLFVIVYNIVVTGFFIQKKPIQLLKYVPAIDQLVILVDGLVCVFDTTTFDLSNRHEKLKNAHTFCVDEQKDRSNPFSQQVSCNCYRSV